MPITEAAGPEKIDCTGMERDCGKGMVPPSALSMFTLTCDSPMSTSEFSTAVANSLYNRHTAQLK